MAVATGAPNTGWTGKIGDFEPMSHYNSEVVQDSDIFTIVG